MTPPSSNSAADPLPADFFQCPELKDAAFWQIPDTLGGRYMRILRAIQGDDAAALGRLLDAGWPGPAMVAANPLAAAERAEWRTNFDCRRRLAEGLTVDNTPAEVPIPEADIPGVLAASAAPYTYAPEVHKLTCAHLLWAPLKETIWKNRPDMAEALLKAGALPWFGGKDADHPVTFAVMHKRAAMLELLLRYGASPESADTKYQPLVLAIRAKQLRLVQLLCGALEPGAELPWGRDHGPLRYAYESDCPEIIAAVSPHARAEDYDDAWETALPEEPDAEADERIITAFIAGGADPSAALLTVLRSAWTSEEELGCERFSARGVGVARRVRRLLELGANAEASDKDGDTLLLVAAAQCPFPEVIDALVSAGASLHAKNTAGDDLLRCCAFSDYGHAAVFRRIVALGFSADSLLADTSWLEKLAGKVPCMIPLRAADWTDAQWRRLFDTHAQGICQYAHDALANPSLPPVLRETLLLTKAGQA